MDLEKDAAETANIVLQADSQAGDKDFVTVRFLAGYSIGFTRFSGTQRVINSPETWTKQIQEFDLRSPSE